MDIQSKPYIGDGSETDPLYFAAVKYVVDNQRASISGVQRFLKIGYHRAATMIVTMERKGIVSPADSKGLREVLRHA